MGTANNKPETKKMCGLWCILVPLSEYNDYGACSCIGCAGERCNVCQIYAEIKAQIRNVSKCARCDKCLGR